MANLLQNLPVCFDEELVDILAEKASVRIERILSRGHRSPDGFWYDQDEHEWIILLQGAARLLFDDQQCIDLAPGEYVNIAAHRRHRVDWTTPNETTVWLAVFYRD